MGDPWDHFIILNRRAHLSQYHAAILAFKYSYYTSNRKSFSFFCTDQHANYFYPDPAAGVTGPSPCGMVTQQQPFFFYVLAIAVQCMHAGFSNPAKKYCMFLILLSFLFWSRLQADNDIDVSSCESEGGILRGRSTYYKRGWFALLCCIKQLKGIKPFHKVTLSCLHCAHALQG